MATTEHSSAVDNGDLIIPLVDFSHFLHGSPDERLSAAKAVLGGFQKAGFIYLKNHGIAPATVSRVFSESATYFRRPREEKEGMAWTTPESNRGYSAPGREKVTQIGDRAEVEALRAAVPDLKESYEVGRDDVPETPNNWPDQRDESGRRFRSVMNSFFGECQTLHVEVMRAIALGLGIDVHWFDEYTDDGDNTLRLLHYPEVERSVFQSTKGQVRAGEHTDYGSITLLFQDDRGGLQVQSPNGHFVDATPIPDTIVVNSGDLLARWANDNIKSTTHRVVEPPAKPGDDASRKEHPARYSVAYFCNPNFDKFIDAIPGTFEETGKKYAGVNSGEYLVQRLAATY